MSARGLATGARLLAAAGLHLPRAALSAARPSRGQATIEVVALLPILILVAAAGFHVLAAGRAAEAAGSAAAAGAVAMLQERDPRAAARAALDGWPRRAVEVRIAGRRVSVTVRPGGVRWLAERLTARSVAFAGGPPVLRPTGAVRGGDGSLTGGVRGGREARR